MNKEQKERLKKALSEIGIRTEADLREAIKRLPPLNIYIMTDPAAGKVGAYGH